MSKTPDQGRDNGLPSSAPSPSERESGETNSVTPEEGVCLLCTGPLAAEGWCNQCQLSRATRERIFREQRSEESRTPCAPLALLALITLLVAVGTIIWVVLKI